MSTARIFSFSDRRIFTTEDAKNTGEGDLGSASGKLLCFSKGAFFDQRLLLDLRTLRGEISDFTIGIETTLPQQNPNFVRRTFAAIATRYDLANHLLSGGFDFLWRAKAARIIAADDPGHILDLATGSGDLARALAKASPRSVVIGADFCLPMLEIARKKRIRLLVQADGLQLPFHDGKFEALTVAFGLRNMASWKAALEEMARVLRPGGVLLIMDFSLPQFPPLRNFYRLYLHNVLPRFAAIITGNREAYEYLGNSIESFPRGRKMEELVRSSGFSDFRAKPLCCGVATIYTARRAL